MHRAAIRIILSLAISLTVVSPGQAGVASKLLKGGIAAGGFNLCLRNSTCRGGLMAGGTALAMFLVQHFGEQAADRCMRSPECGDRISDLIERGGNGADILRQIGILLTTGDGGSGEKGGRDVAQAPSSTADASPPPEDGDEEVQKEKLTASDKKLKHTYDGHAKDFGIEGNRNNKTMAAFKRELDRFINAPTTKRYQGTYRGKTPVDHFFDPETELWVGRNSDTGELEAAFKLGRSQIEWLLKNGNVQ